MATADFTIADVLAWARTKPADELYDYGDIHNCALCQFLKDTGRIANPSVGPDIYYPVGRSAEARPLPADLNDALIGAGDWVAGECYTFGRLASRLEKLCPETPVTASSWAAIDAYMHDIESVEA